MKNLESQLTAERNRAEKETAVAREQYAIWSWLRAHPDRNVDANISLLVEYIRPLDVSSETLDQAFAAIEPQLASISIQRGQDRIRDEDAAERIKADAAVELVKQNAATAEADQKKRWRSLSKEELRAEIKQMKAVDEISLPAVDVPYSRKQLVSMDTAEMKRLLYTSNGEQRPGVEAEVNRILAAG